ncbi:MAG: LamG domain-containing protein [Candidatus Acidiferrales bacterium]
MKFRFSVTSLFGRPFAFVSVALTSVLLLIWFAGGASVRASGTGLAALWHIDRVHDDISTPDSSENGNTGLLIGATRVPGKYRGGLGFDGVSNFVSVGNPASLQITSALTLEAWINAVDFNLPAGQGDANIYIVSKDDTSGRSYGIGVSNVPLPPTSGCGAGGPHAFMIAFTTSGIVIACGATPVSTGVFHHIAGTYDSATGIASVYLDGLLDGTATGTPAPINNTPAEVEIGARQFAGFRAFFHGTIDEVRIWSRALGASEINADVQGGLMLLDHFNSDASDNSGFGNNGALNGGPAFVPAEFGNGISLTSGSSQFVSIPHSSTLDFSDETHPGFSGPYTLEAWVNVAGTAGNIADYQPIFFRNSPGDDIEVYVQVGSNELVAFHNRANGAPFNCVLFLPPPQNTLFHLAVVWDGANFNAYYNGVAIAPDAAGTASQCAGSKAGQGAKVSGGGWLIGRTDGFGTHFFQGVIDEAHFWNRALSANEVAFIAGANGDTTGQLLLPEAIGQDDDAGQVFANDYDSDSPTMPLRSMGLQFIVTGNPGTSINPPAAHRPCVSDRGSGPGDDDNRGGLLACQIDGSGKITLFTAKQINLEEGDDEEIELSEFIRLRLNLSDGRRHGFDVDWLP